MIRTAATLQGLGVLAGHRVVVEVLTSMRRYGFERAQLGLLGPLLESVQVEGFALHLPLEPGPRGHVGEVEDTLAATAQRRARRQRRSG